MWTNNDRICCIKCKTCSFLKDKNGKGKKAKGTKNCFTKRKLKFKDYKNCLAATQLENEINELEKNEVNVDD